MLYYFSYKVKFMLDRIQQGNDLYFPHPLFFYEINFVNILGIKILRLYFFVQYGEYCIGKKILTCTQVKTFCF